MMAPMRLLLAIVALVATSPAQAATYWVHNAAEFQNAVAATQSRGGRIVLLPGRYAEPLVVSGNGPLRIIGRPGAIVRDLLLYRARRVSVGPLRIGPLAGATHFSRSANRSTSSSITSESPPKEHASPPMWRYPTRAGYCFSTASSHIAATVLRVGQLPVVARGGPARDGRAQLVPRLSRLRLVHGQVASHLTIRSSRFERALPCRADRINWPLLRLNLGSFASDRCGHQDLVQVTGGKDLRFVDNQFGVYKRGAAQLFLTGPIRRAVIARNVFSATDPECAWMALARRRDQLRRGRRPTLTATRRCRAQQDLCGRPAAGRLRRVHLGQPELPLACPSLAAPAYRAQSHRPAGDAGQRVRRGAFGRQHDRARKGLSGAVGPAGRCRGSGLCVVPKRRENPVLGAWMLRIRRLDVPGVAEAMDDAGRRGHVRAGRRAEHLAADRELGLALEHVERVDVVVVRVQVDALERGAEAHVDDLELGQLGEHAEGAGAA